MSIFEKIGEKLSGAGQGVAQQVKNFADVARLNNFFIDILNIGGRQRYNIVRINSSCLAVGRRLF